MSRIPDSVIEEIKDRAEISQVVREYVSLTHKGGNYVGLCPFHNEKTPSFTVTPSKGIFYCFGCHKGGNVFKFIMEIEGMSFPEAVKFLGEKHGVEVDQQENPTDSRRDALFDLYSRVSGLFRYLLEKTPEAEAARSYLDSRGMQKETLEAFGIGYAPPDRRWLYRFLRKKQFSVEFLAESGLFSSRYPEVCLFSNRIVFPLRDLHGRPLGFSGRLLEGDGPKYINTPETRIFHKGSNLFGLDQAVSSLRKGEEAVLCEGNVDVLALHQAGMPQAVAPLGTAFTSDQARLLKRYVTRCQIMFDGDAAGLKAAEKAVVVLRQAGIETFHVSLPPGSDPADILKKEGEESLKKLGKYPINSFEYLLERYAHQYDPSTVEGKKAILGVIFPYIRQLDSEVERESRLTEVAERLKVDIRSVLSDYYREEKSAVQTPEQSLPGVEFNTDLFLLIAVIANRQYFQWVRNLLHAEDFEGEWARSLFISLEECYREEDESVDGLLSRVEDETLQALILEKLSSEEFQINNVRLIKDAVFTLKGRRIKKRIADLVLRISHADAQNNSTAVNEYLLEKMHLDKELEKIKVIDDDRAAE